MPTGELDVLSIELGALQTRHPSRFQSQLLLDALEDLRLNIVANPRAASLASRLLSQSNRSIDVLSQPLQSASQGLEALQGIDMQGVYHGGENPWESSVELNGLCRPALQLLASLASGRRLPNSTQEDHTTSTWRDTSNSRFKTIQSAVTHTSAWHERVFKMGSGFEPRRRRLLSEIDGTRFVYSGKLSKDLYGLRRVTIQSELYGLRHEKRYDTKEKRQKAFTHITRNPGLRSRQRELLIRGLGRTCTECTDSSHLTASTLSSTVPPSPSRVATPTLRSAERSSHSYATSCGLPYTGRECGSEWPGHRSWTQPVTSMVY